MTKPENDARTPPVAVWQVLDGLRGDELKAWRLQDIENPATIEQRNLDKLPIPFGWFVVDYADDLAIGEVKPLHYFGAQLVLWRGGDGKARIIDAYCRHLGANMAYGGRVNGNELECPFHAWTYNSEGSVMSVPYAERIPPTAARPCEAQWTVQEANKFIWVWYHPEGQPPSYDLDVFEEVGNADWTEYERFEWIVHGPIQNMSENGVDSAHFKYIHGVPEMPNYDMEFDGHRRTASVKSKLGTPKGEVDGMISYGTIGAGQSWTKFTGISETLLVSGVTPIARDKTHVRFAFTQPKAEAEGAMANLSKALIRDICKQLDQDKVVWDRQKYILRPSICDGDGPIMPFRKYFEQFYADGAQDSSVTNLKFEQEGNQ